MEYSVKEHKNVHQHHDIEPLPNGNILILAWEKKTANEAENMGATNLNTDEIWPEHIIELEKETNNIVWEWHAWDHIIQDTDPSLPNYGSISENPQRININYKKPNNNPNNLSPFNGNGDWMHANSIDYNADLDQIIISVRRWNEIWIIDHSTTSEQAEGSFGGFYGKGGDILYRWGNPEAYNQGSLDNKKFWGQHDAKWINKNYTDGGKIMIFNNGSQTAGSEAREFSSIDIINPPINDQGNYFLEENGTYGPIELDWSYTSENPYDFYADHISGSSRLENGNTIICNGPQGNFFEINPLGDIVWEYINPITASGILSQGDIVIDGQNPVFNCKRYTHNYPAFANRDLTPNGYIELNSIDYMLSLIHI